MRVGLIETAGSVFNQDTLHALAGHVRKLLLIYDRDLGSLVGRASVASAGGTRSHSQQDSRAAEFFDHWRCLSGTSVSGRDDGGRSGRLCPGSEPLGEIDLSKTGGVVGNQGVLFELRAEVWNVG